MLKLRHPSLLREQTLIDGAWCGVIGGASLPVTDPACGAVIGPVPDMGAAETKATIASCPKAPPAWATETAATRAGILMRWLGPLINQKALEKVEAHLSDAVSKGVRLLSGGARHALGGTCFQPTVLVDLTDDLQIAHEKTFGPIAGLFWFESEHHVTALANASNAGLASYISPTICGASGVSRRPCKPAWLG